MKMEKIIRTVKIKSVTGISLADPRVEAGKIAGGGIYEITNVPDNISDSDLILEFKDTTNMTWLFSKRYAIDFNELGIGKIIR